MTIQAFCGGELHQPGAANLLRLLLFAPLIEEWIVRAGLQEWLMRRSGQLGQFGQFGQAGQPGQRSWCNWPVNVAIVVLCTAFFSVLHARAGAVVAVQVFLPGLALSALYQVYRDWRLCALLHAMFNAIALAACAVIF